ncbi:MAG: fused MFS/spermidine synthase [Sphingomonas sp.]|jgi:spermidine synthase|uniref:spermidine synthase n=1 Tax=Sphingomonas sp. TaxID=28214 RepID=UPI00356201FE
MTRTRGARPLFVAAVLASSFLLFLVQPMIARMALPRLGGAPAVWNSAMLVYQALLLAGYGYAHWLGKLSPRMQAATHLAVLVMAALWLPIGLVAATLPVDAEPALWVPWLLCLSIGPLFFAISAQAPLLQRWFSFAAPQADPYPLYAASNIGSFAGLIAYPLLVEPQLALAGQRWLWSIGYGAVALLVAACAWRLPRGAAGATVTPATSPRPAPPMVARWIVLALVPSGLMLATSTYITTDIVAMPLLWVMPLGLYLLSFSIAFAANRRTADVIARITPLALLLIGGLLVGSGPGWPYFDAALALGLLFLVSVTLHGEMYRLRPASDRLTGFYLAMSIGGVLGGVFAALVAPILFNWTWEYPILLLAAGMLMPRRFMLRWSRRLWGRHPGRRWSLVLATALLVALLILVVVNLPGAGAERPGAVQLLVLAVMVPLGLATIGYRPAFGIALIGALIAFGGYRSLVLSIQPGTRTRSYFGVYTVLGDAQVRQLAHGTTAHGTELFGTPAREREPTVYYVRGTGIGRAMQALPALYGRNARVAVVGLGAGTLACYAQPGQQWRFYEIDPAIVRIARDTGQFHFLRDCLPDAGIVLGDARISLAASPPAQFDLLALDAFSSDSVPMHLMTREAFAGYARVLAPDGLLLVHISNRFLDLEPVVASAAEGGGWHAMRLLYQPRPGEGAAATRSLWVALSHDPGKLAALRTRDATWQPLRHYPDFAPWTDDYSTILPLIKALH